MRRKSTYISHIVILLNLLISNDVVGSFENGINIQPDRINTKSRSDHSVHTGSTIWQSSSRSSENSIAGNQFIQPQFTNSQEIKEDKDQKTAHTFHKNWQGTVHLFKRHNFSRTKSNLAFFFLQWNFFNYKDVVDVPQRFEKVLVKRAFEGVGSSISGLGKSIEGLAKNNNVEDFSGLPKVLRYKKLTVSLHDDETLLDVDLSDLGPGYKGLRGSGQDDSKFDRDISLLGALDSDLEVNSLPEESKLPPVQKPSRSESLPILSSKESQEIHRLKVLEHLDIKYKPFSELTDQFMRSVPDPNHEENDELSILAHLALYSEKLLFQSALEGEKNVKIDQLATQLEKHRSIYVNELKKGVETKEFLNEVYVEALEKEVSDMRNSIWARTVTPSELKAVQADEVTLAKQAKRVSFLETLDESEGRQKASKDIMKKSLANIAADAYLDTRTARSNTVINPPKDATKKMVIKLANQAQDAALILDSGPLRNIQNGKQARETRKAFKLYIETYAQRNRIDYSLLIDLQKISDRREIRVETRLSFWSDHLKTKFRKLISQLITSIFKKNKEVSS
ncbi:uncharacterized protein MELLADRAFT_67817 [Melampsora larici-populina 98AG31]|uniref:Secreted protein n=1 Tax=Melampsora larici-populina (strain 98AG31 / pathotype 3-4-7) TaxID=747676 RepID=F4S4I9_MELLP|nr:uncharacterized protein MELLADRAFT_67817 [Melampsora larici-populina 98AG31]EGG00458.1 hypothetical protein MELLADRAFT_67817 [Melampsora larici-populina 98AG31]